MSSRRELIKANERNQNIIMLLIGAGFVLLAVAVYFGIRSTSQTIQEQGGISAIPVEVNFVAPDIKLTDLNGNPVAFSDYRGKVILYNAWATWCPPCKEEMPVLQAFYDDYRDQGLVIIAIEDGEPVDEVAQFVSDHRLTFPVWPDLKWVATETFKIDSLPTSYVIDRHGNARLTWRGAITRDLLEKYITPLLKED